VVSLTIIGMVGFVSAATDVCTTAAVESNNKLIKRGCLEREIKRFTGVISLDGVQDTIGSSGEAQRRRPSGVWSFKAGIRSIRS
jgi:hypothetical protein